MNIFNILEYKEVIRSFIEANKEVYGYRAQMAQAAGCQRSYFSQVLHSHQDLTVEQALGLAIFWNLSALEQEYFVALASLARAGTPQLQAFYERKLKSMRAQQADLARRYEKTNIMESAETTSRYYSSWHYAAIHIATTIPAYQSHGAIAERLRLDLEIVRDAIHFLSSAGLVEVEGDRIKCKQVSVHLPRDSHMNQVNHLTWRQKSLSEMILPGSNDVHYTAVYSLSHRDAVALRDLILKMLDQSRQLVAPSLEEELVCLTCDLFALGKK